MKISVKTKGKLSDNRAVVVWLGEEGKSGLFFKQLPADLKRSVAPLIEKKRFSGKAGSAFLQGTGAGWLVLTGIGKEKKLCLNRLRKSGAVAARTALAARLLELAVPVPSVPKATVEQTAQAVVEGVWLGTYHFDRKGTKSKEETGLKELELTVSAAPAVSAAQKGARQGKILCESVCLARDLGNAPSNEMTPARLAQAAQKAGREAGFRVQVWGPAEIAKRKMGALMGVARGSREPARFIRMEYVGPRSAGRKPLLLVGKGITFDSGGISIKPSNKMEEMKFDMCGAAAVIGAMRAIAMLKLPARVVGLAPATENLPGGSAQKPGDIVRAMNGKTIEVINTDAEGRLILADALSYAQTLKPAAIVDLATLTGACVVALGDQAAGLMGNDERLLEQVKQAGSRSGDKVWPLPLWKAHTDAVRSQVADVKNVGNGKAGTITAAAFLKEFVGEFPWAHLDIAGTAWADGTCGYQVKGGTGFGVRLLVEWVKGWR